MADEASRDTYAGVLRARMTGISSYIPIADYPQYFHPEVVLQPGDVVIEGGIDDGRTTYQFSRCVGPQGRIIAFEPSPQALPFLKTQFASATNVTIEPQGLWSSRTTLPLSCNGGASSVTNLNGNTIPCDFIDLDSYVRAHSLRRCDMIKMDIEGAEREALKGAIETIRCFKPKLAISVYHGPVTEFLKIIQLLASLNAGYTFYLGHHEPFHNETVLYGCPPESKN